MVLGPMHDAHPPHAIYRLVDERSCLDAVLVMHSNRLGPSLGPCCFGGLGDAAQMSDFAIRQARSMTYRAALSGLPFGGGCIVIRRPPAMFDRAALFRALGDGVEKREGKFVAWQGRGTDMLDMKDMACTTSHVAGIVPCIGTIGANTAPFLAKGVFNAMKAALTHRFGVGFDQVSVAVVGLGKAGFALCRLLHQEGASLIVKDEDESRMYLAERCFGARSLRRENILTADVDILAPCSSQIQISKKHVPWIKARIICGASDDQLVTSDVARLLAAREILYVPDFAANSGGMINAAAEYLNWTQAQADALIDALGSRVADIIHSARHEDLSPLEAAREMAGHMMTSNSLANANQAAGNGSRDVEGLSGHEALHQAATG
ncbi:MAG: Glu/Leu/Phe/Val dehydrogenase dimerization domain-containing protein [Sphingorhabdus sp.]